MDQPHDGFVAAAEAPRPADDDAQRSVPQDDDEKFIVSLVLSYYRRHPQRARTRLLDLLGEALTPPAAPSASHKAVQPSPAKSTELADDAWLRARAAVAPLKRKR